MGEFQKQGFFRLFCGRDDLKENKRLHEIFSQTIRIPQKTLLEKWGPKKLKKFADFGKVKK